MVRLETLAKAAASFVVPRRRVGAVVFGLSLIKWESDCREMGAGIYFPLFLLLPYWRKTKATAYEL